MIYTVYTLIDLTKRFVGLISVLNLTCFSSATNNFTITWTVTPEWENDTSLFSVSLLLVNICKAFLIAQTLSLRVSSKRKNLHVS